MIVWLLIALACVVLYISWYISIYSWTRLAELGVEHTRSFLSFFDGIARSGILGLVIARLTWIALNWGELSDVPWSIFPYIRTADGIDWFMLFPWRLLRLTEGVYYPVLWAVWGVFAALVTYVPTLRFARKLRVDKRSVMRNFILRGILGMVLVLMLTAGAVYSSI